MNICDIGLVTIASLFGVVIGIIVCIKCLENRISEVCLLNDKYFGIIRCFCLWMSFYENGHSIDEYFKKNHYQTIAIYGLGFLGEHFVEQIINTDIEVKYIIEQREDAAFRDIPIVNVNDSIEAVDVVVISSQFYYYQMKSNLENRFKTVCIHDIFK